MQLPCIPNMYLKVCFSYISNNTWPNIDYMMSGMFLYFSKATIEFNIRNTLNIYIQYICANTSYKLL